VNKIESEETSSPASGLGATPGDTTTTAMVVPDLMPTVADTPQLPQLEMPIDIPMSMEIPNLPGSKKRGRPSNADKAAKLNGVTPPPPKPAPNPPIFAPVNRVDYDAMGIIAASMFFGLGELALGEDWAPEPDEKMPIKDAFSAYFRSINAVELPPSWILLSALGVYTVKRVNRPTVKSKIYGAFAWLKHKLPFSR
jgi:hypothetical protein